MRFVEINGGRLINLDAVSEIRRNEFDVKGKPCCKVYFFGSNGDTRDCTTVTPEEGESLALNARAFSVSR